MVRCLPLLLLLGLLLAGPARAQHVDTPLGAAPAGFHWQVLPEARAAMLLPDGWYFKAEVEKKGLTYYLTQDEIGESGLFQTGATLRVVRRVKSQTKLPAATYAERLMMRAGFGRGQRQLEQSAVAEGTFSRRAVRYREALPDAEPRVVYQLALSNSRTDTLYLLVFESPEKEWAEAWQAGEVMVKELTLDAKL